LYSFYYPDVHPIFFTTVIHVVAIPDTIDTPLTLADLLQPYHPTIQDSVTCLAESPSQEVVCKLWARTYSIPLAGHSGAAYTSTCISAAITCSGMATALIKLCQACLTCQKLCALPLTPAALASTHVSTSTESVFADFIDLLHLSNGYYHILVMVNHFNHYCCFIVIKDTSAHSFRQPLQWLDLLFWFVPSADH